MSKTWDAQFKPFADDLAALDRKITDWLADKTYRELMQIRADGEKRTSSNCWWAVYQVVPMVMALIEQEMYRRKHASALFPVVVDGSPEPVPDDVQDHVTGV